MVLGDGQSNGVI